MNKDSPSTKYQWPSQRTGERVDIKETSCPQDGKLSLKVDESQVGQWHGYVEWKWEYYHIIIFPLKDFEFYIKKEEDK